jgi:hypothetical protein
MKVFALFTLSLLFIFNAFSMDQGFWALQAKLHAQRQKQQAQIIRPASPTSSTPTSPKQKRRASLPNIKIEYVQQDLTNQITIQSNAQVSLKNKNYIRPQPTCLDRATADFMLAQFENDKREKRATLATLSATIKRTVSAPIANTSHMQKQATWTVLTPCAFVFAHDGIILMQ